MKIELKFTPVKDIMINQKFGNDFWWYNNEKKKNIWFYKDGLGIIGHNGIDFETKTGCPVVASHDGIIVFTGTDGDGGISVEILSNKTGEGFKTIYYHLKDVCVNVGDEVKAGKLIGHADNTGKFTTGDHLHFGLKRTYDGTTMNKDNGYQGAIDPAPHFIDRDWDKTNAFKRYGRKRTWTTYLSEVRVMLALKKYLKRTPTQEQINACTYGAWDRETVKDDAMAYNWKYLTKSQYQNGEKPFC
jgi:murein DD-endopeptidase MepM/ murein hydrolase activator NlpD